MDEKAFCTAVQAEFSKNAKGYTAAKIDWSKLFQIIQTLMPFILAFLQPTPPVPPTP